MKGEGRKGKEREGKERKQTVEISRRAKIFGRAKTVEQKYLVEQKRSSKNICRAKISVEQKYLSSKNGRAKIFGRAKTVEQKYLSSKNIGRAKIFVEQKYRSSKNICRANRCANRPAEASCRTVPWDAPCSKNIIKSMVYHLFFLLGRFCS